MKDSPFDPEDFLDLPPALPSAQDMAPVGRPADLAVAPPPAQGSAPRPEALAAPPAPPHPAAPALPEIVTPPVYVRQGDRWVQQTPQPARAPAPLANAAPIHPERTGPDHRTPGQHDAEHHPRLASPQAPVPLRPPFAEGPSRHLTPPANQSAAPQATCPHPGTPTLARAEPQGREPQRPDTPHPPEFRHHHPAALHAAAPRPEARHPDSAPLHLPHPAELGHRPAPPQPSPAPFPPSAQVAEPLVVRWQGFEHRTRSWSGLGFTLDAPFPVAAGPVNGHTLIVALLIGRGPMRLDLRVRARAVTADDPQPTRFAFVGLGRQEADLLAALADHLGALEALTPQHLFPAPTQAAPGPQPCRPAIPDSAIPDSETPDSETPGSEAARPEAPNPTADLSPDPAQMPVLAAARTPPQAQHGSPPAARRPPLAARAPLGAPVAAPLRADTPPAAPVTTATQPTPPSRGLRRFGARLRMVLVLGALAGLGVVAWDRTTLLHARHAAVTTSALTFGAPASGTITRLDLQIGQRLRPGAVMGSLQPEISGTGADAALPLLAPCDCTVLTREVRAGERVAAGQSLALVSGPEAPAIHALIDADAARGLEPGARAAIRLADGTALSGRVIRIERRADWDARVGLPTPVFAADRFVRLEIAADTPLQAPVGTAAAIRLQPDRRLAWLRARLGL